MTALKLYAIVLLCAKKGGETLTSRERATEYMNLMAKCLKILENYPSKRFEELETLNGFETITKQMRIHLDCLWKKGIDIFLPDLSNTINDLSLDTAQERFIKAYEICQWLDDHITYRATNEITHKLSLWPICKINNITPTILWSLNSNYSSVGIWINPKFEIRSAYDADTLRSIIISNRDAFSKMNGLLKNCSYYNYDNKRIVRNIIISPNSIFQGKKDTLTIAFAPLTSEKNIIKRKNVIFRKNSCEYSGMELSLSADKDNLLTRMKKDWLAASANNIDILFMPEMLGTEDSCGLNKCHIEWVRDLYITREKEKHAPAITILPSYWANGRNTATIVSYNGTVLGIQRKSVPFISRKDHMMEALDDFNPKETILLHIPGMHRIGVMICSEFLSDEQLNWRDYLCGCLGITLMIVPSYSSGEKEFINLLPTFKDYDTTVIWGNCCGAIQSESKGIGGCGISGTNISEVFGKYCKCNHTCANVDSCMFTVSLSLRQPVTKNNSIEDKSVIDHCIKQLDI